MNPWQGTLRLAGLQADFEIRDVKQFETTKKVYLYLTRRDRGGCCSGCGQRSTVIHSADQIQLRDLPVFEYQVYLVVERFTLWCTRCRRHLVEDFWLWRKRKDFTWRYEQKVSRMCEEMTNISVARLEGRTSSLRPVAVSSVIF
jgi:transposase